MNTFFLCMCVCASASHLVTVDFCDSSKVSFIFVTYHLTRSQDKYKNVTSRLVVVQSDVQKCNCAKRCVV